MLQEQNFNIIGKESNLTGDFLFEGPTKILGTLNGKIQITNEARLILEMNSTINADLNCYDVDIYGNFEGKIESKGKISVYPTANCKGSFLSKSFEIYPGALLNITGNAE